MCLSITLLRCSNEMHTFFTRPRLWPAIETNSSMHGRVALRGASGGILPSLVSFSFHFSITQVRPPSLEKFLYRALHGQTHLVLVMVVGTSAASKCTPDGGTGDSTAGSTAAVVGAFVRGSNANFLEVVCVCTRTSLGWEDPENELEVERRLLFSFVTVLVRGLLELAEPKGRRGAGLTRRLGSTCRSGFTTDKVDFDLPEEAPAGSKSFFFFLPPPRYSMVSPGGCRDLLDAPAGFVTFVGSFDLVRQTRTTTIATNNNKTSIH